MLQTRTPAPPQAEARLAPYRRVAAAPDGLIRRPDEIDLAARETLDFVNEGRQAGKILNADGQLETPLPMAWFRAATSDGRGAG